jgi:hypothetical protein
MNISTSLLPLLAASVAMPPQRIELADHPREPEPEPLDIPRGAYPWSLSSDSYAVSLPYRDSRPIDGERYGTPPTDDAARLAAARRQAKAASRPRNRR